MKLDKWAMQFHILEINKVLPPNTRWPRLEQLLAALELLPRTSAQRYGAGIFIGWAGLDGNWAYHHTICIPGSHSDGQWYAYHAYADRNTIATMPGIYPVFNVGDLPETQDFIKALASIGISADENSPVLSPAKIFETRSS